MSVSLHAKLLGGELAGQGRVVCPGPGHSRNDRSLSVTFSADGFVVHSFAGDDWRDCRDHVADLLGVGRTRFSPPNYETLRKLSEADAAQAKKMEVRAVACWQASRPIAGTIAETYLRNRGITCDLPSTLRFHPDCWHPNAMRLPAMIALVDGAERFSVHRTYIKADGSGKANVKPAKAMLGAVAGGAVRLTEGGCRLAVCEGIETGLSLASGLASGNPTIWAALSTSGMKRLTLPSSPGQILIATDGDTAGRMAGKDLATSAALASWSVSLLPAPEGHDWNDILMMKGRAA